ncbi:MAG: hypothetical protein AVDCRST_MAG49-2996, partial [uncultured Thermomicrobiales bacterium]
CRSCTRGPYDTSSVRRRTSASAGRPKGREPFSRRPARSETDWAPPRRQVMLNAG